MGQIVSPATVVKVEGEGMKNFSNNLKARLNNSKTSF